MINLAKRNVVVFYYNNPFFNESYVEMIEQDEFVVEFFDNAIKLFDYIKQHPQDIRIIIMDLIVSDDGNDFGGRVTNDLQNTALLVLDDLAVMEKEVPVMIPIKKLLLSSWRDRELARMKADSRLFGAVQAIDVGILDLARIVKTLRI